MGITHAKVSTRPPSGDPDEISRDEWNAEHVVDGDFGGGIDFDQANEGGYLSVVATDVATLILNDTDGGFDANLLGTGGSGINIQDDAGGVSVQSTGSSLQVTSGGLSAIAASGKTCTVGAGGGTLLVDADSLELSTAGIASLKLNDTGASFDATLVSSAGGIKFVGGAGQRLSMENDGTFIGWTASEPLGFYGATPIVRPTVTGSTGGNAALASLLAALADLGLIVDSTT